MMGLRLFGSRAAPAPVPASAPIARERLQILLAHERGLRGQPDLLDLLRSEILAVVSRHVAFDPEKLNIRMERGNDVSTLEIDIEVPNLAAVRSVAVA
jgi:cell division topological specificity factor